VVITAEPGCPRQRVELEVGDGMGGTREDSGYQDMDARI
jgi:hypothetical protein